jgi:hypothetical protein
MISVQCSKQIIHDLILKLLERLVKNEQTTNNNGSTIFSG